LFEADGYTVTAWNGLRDRGIDLVLHRGTVRHVVQCRRQSREIGPLAVRHLRSATLATGALHGFLVTTASFTVTAREVAEGRPLTLVDGPALLAWIERTARRRADRGVAGTGAHFDPNAVLGVRVGATKDEIKVAYRQLVARYHPDKVVHLGHEFQEIAKEKTQAIIRAYTVLMAS
jgi:hypothetical protein